MQVSTKWLRNWSVKNPHIFYETALVSVQIGIGYLISQKWIVGLMFFVGSVMPAGYQQTLTDCTALMEEVKLAAVTRRNSPHND